MQNHLFLASDGDLFDTRNPAWSKAAPLRRGFSFHHRNIDNVAQLKATLRAGPYAWPGGYPLALYLSDGELLCFDCARENIRSVFDSTANALRDGWRVFACDMIESGEDETDNICGHCGKPIGFDVVEEKAE
jgi:hypothetical protein